MKNFGLCLLIATFFGLAACAPSTTDATAKKEASPAKETEQSAPTEPPELLSNDEVLALIDEIKPALSTFMDDYAISFEETDTNGETICLDVFAEKADAFEASTGMLIKQISVNPVFDSMAANDWEKESFDRFITSNQNGFPYPEVHRARFYEGDGSDIVFEYARPFGSRDPFAACHGETDTIDKVTPRSHEDDLSGAFLVTKRIQSD